MTYSLGILCAALPPLALIGLVWLVCRYRKQKRSRELFEALYLARRIG